MPSNHRKQRVPALKYTKNRNIGWHVSYRDPESGTPRKYRFGTVTRAEAEKAYHEWVAAHLQGQTPTKTSSTHKRKIDAILSEPPESPKGVETDVIQGSLLHVASSLLRFEESRVRESRGPRRQGSICRPVYDQRKQFAQEFLRFLNSRHGSGSVGRMKLADLTMTDVEDYNRTIVQAGYSSSQVTKRLQMVKAVIDRAGRPENGAQFSRGTGMQEMSSTEHLQKRKSCRP